MCFFKKRITTECGHETKERDVIIAFGEKTITKLPVKNGRTPYCHRCIEKMAIRCAWCGKVIFIGDPITLYTPSNKNFKIPEYAIVYNKKPLQLVGCLRWDCAETGGDRAGFWIPPGKVERVPTGFELSVQDLKQGGSGIVVIEDLNKP